MFYVTLTTIFEKQDRCAFVLNHLLTNQTRQPEKVLLHLSEEPYLLDKGFANKQITHPQLNQVLEKFSDRIEIRWVKNIGPYRKLIYTMKDLWESESLMITIDDDFVYNKNLFENHLNDYEREQCSINYRGFTSNVTSFETMNRFQYQVFRKIIHNRSVYNFSTNGAGTVFSSSMFKSNDAQGFLWSISQPGVPSSLVPIFSQFIPSLNCDSKWLYISYTLAL